MKKTLAILTALMIALLLPLTALAGAALDSSVMLEKSAYLGKASNTYTVYQNRAYTLYDADGNALASGYANMSNRLSGMYYEVYSQGGLNNLGVIDASGKVVLPEAYGDVIFLSDKWILGYVLQATNADTGDYKDSDNNRFNVIRTDVVFEGKIIGSLTREEMQPAFSTGTRGDFMYVRKTSETGYWLDAAFNRVDVQDDYFSTSEYQEVYGKGVLHNPTQQYAFTSTCTLTPDQVVQSVRYDKDGNFVDLQGNIISQGPTSYAEYNSVRFYGGDYMIAKANSGSGVVSTAGQEIIPLKYDTIAYDSDLGMFTSGYQAVLDKEGHLTYYDRSGNVTTSVNYALSYSDYKGFSYNSPIVAVNNMGQYIIITATHGELAEKYEDVSTPRTNHRIITVKKDGLWGCIDMAGNTVVPFVHNYSLDISDDATLVLGVTSAREQMVYRLSYTDDVPVAAQNAAADGSWTCSCGASNTGKFCAECGAKKPEPAPVADGSWTCTCGSVNTGKFCPECGSKKPEAPVDPQCASCGYKPEGAAPKFCPECGSKF